MPEDVKSYDALVNKTEDLNTISNAIKEGANLAAWVCEVVDKIVGPAQRENNISVASAVDGVMPSIASHARHANTDIQYAIGRVNDLRDYFNAK